MPLPEPKLIHGQVNLLVDSAGNEISDPAHKALKTTPAWVFGLPSLTSANNGKVSWDRGSTSPLDQKGSTGWLARLYGGLQTGDDWARVNIPVNEMKLSDLATALWSWYQTNAEVYGVNIVVWVHDPNDFDKRAEVTQAPSGVTLENGAGFNAHEFNPATVQMFFYGEGTEGSDLTAGTQYTWNQFITDVLFGGWRIYRITLEMGWYSTGTFEDVWVADIKINGIVIPLGPVNGRHSKTISVAKTMLAAAKAAGDVVSENATTGTDWDFDFGGTGYITKAVITHDATLTDRLRLYLFSQPPTSETDDNVANTSPLTADQGFFLGTIDFPAFQSQGTGDAFTVATPSTTGNLPLAFDSPVIYGILVTRDGITTVAEALTINLTADMEDN